MVRVLGVRLLVMLLLTALTTAAFVGPLTLPAAAAPAAPWFGPNVKVNQVPAYIAQQPSLAVGSDGVAYLAFLGGTISNQDIFFSKSTDGGWTWSAPVRVNPETAGGGQGDPSIALDANNNIFLVWTDSRGGTDDIYFSKSTDGGISFSSNVLVSLTTANFQREADIAIDHANPSLVHVVWTDNQNALSTGVDIYYANSTDGGLSFNTATRVNNDAGGAEQSQPSVAVAPDSSIYVVWSDGRTAGQGRDIFFSKSTNRGATWTPNIPVDDDTSSAAQTEPSLAVDEGGTIYVSWTDSRTANTAPDVYATRSTNGGASFAANVLVNDDRSITPQWMPSLAVAAGKVYAAWIDYRTGGSTSYDIYLASSTDGIAWSANRMVNDQAAPSSFQSQPSIGVDGTGNVFATWFDNRVTGADVFASVLDVVGPTANAGAGVSADQGTSVSFDGSGSSDNLGIAAAEWDFGDGSRATGLTATHTYGDPGTYTATLTVWDASGNAATATRAVTVRDIIAPIVRGGGDRAIEEGQPLFFDGSASTDNVGVTSYAWDFGDGSTATTATATHVYSRTGTYTVKLTVTDAAGNAATSTFAVTVRPNADMGLIQIMGGALGALAVVIALLGWMLLGMRKRERGVPGPLPRNPGNLPPPPPRDSDPLDMTFPPGQPPKGP